MEENNKEIIMKETLNLFSSIYVSLFALFNFLLFKKYFRKKVGKGYLPILIAMYAIAAICAINVVNDELTREKVEGQWRDNALRKIKKIDEKISHKEKAFVSYAETMDEALNEIKLNSRSNIRSEPKSVDDIILDYFDRVSRIPRNYNESQWKETEGMISRTISKKIENFIFYGPAGLRAGEAIRKHYDNSMALFNKEREKCISSKWRRQ